jgi:phospholipid/cholesterol/gamma-HCH transport system permease protein
MSLGGDWLVHKSELRETDELQSVIDQIGDSTAIRFDTTWLMRWDSDLVAFIWALEAFACSVARPIDIDRSGLPDALQRLLALARADHGQRFPDDSEAENSFLRSSVTLIFHGWDRLVGTAELLGSTVLSLLQWSRGRHRARPADMITLMRESGVNALGIVAVVNGLVGAILAFVGSIQLQRFGAGIFVADLLGIAVVREMAPVMTAIVMAGRTGTAYAAQISTMVGNEEIDALRVIGIPPLRYLVLPRIAALVAMMPALYCYACLIGLAGGYLVSFATLSMSSESFLNELRFAIPPANFCIGLMKSICFGLLIAISSCDIGLRAGRSAADVGHAATNAAVTGIIGIIVLDAVFAACANVLGL